jgi:multiple sugar transport system substrate-binding protein
MSHNHAEGGLPMIPEQREVLDEIVTKVRVGRITRRSFIERAIAIGLTSSTAFALLEACSTAKTASNNNMILWESEHQFIDVYSQLVDIFNKTNKDGIHVVQVSGPIDTGQMHNELMKMLQARSSHVDVMSMDIIWPAEFAGHKWTQPVENKWLESERAKYLPGPIEGCTFDNHIWAVPFHIDVGFIYYRTDLIPALPDTWDELTAVAANVQKQTHQYGYVWQGAQYEGLVCDFVEVLYGYGGAILDPDDPKKVVVNSPQAEEALRRMVSWVGTISPANVIVFKEEDAQIVWQNGQAAFMRNWPQLYPPSNDSTVSRIAGKFAVHPMLFGGSNTIGHSCIGGWQLGINAFSRNQDAAWKFIEYMITFDIQKHLVRDASLLSTLIDIYDDPDVQSAIPFSKNLKSILQNAKPRPSSSKYPDVSSAIQKYVYRALMRDLQPAEALRQLQTDLQAILSS